MLITHPSAKSTFVESKNALSNYLRNKDIKDWYNGVAGLRKFMDDFPDINYRHFAIPSENIGPGPTRLDFNDNFTWPMQLVGRKDCKRDLSLEEGANFKKFIEWYDLPTDEKRKVSLTEFINE